MVDRFAPPKDLFSAFDPTDKKSMKEAFTNVGGDSAAEGALLSTGILHISKTGSEEGDGSITAPYRQPIQALSAIPPTFSGDVLIKCIDDGNKNLLAISNLRTLDGSTYLEASAIPLDIPNPILPQNSAETFDIVNSKMRVRGLSGILTIQDFLDVYESSEHFISLNNGTDTTYHEITQIFSDTEVEVRTEGKTIAETNLFWGELRTATVSLTEKLSVGDFIQVDSAKHKITAVIDDNTAVVTPPFESNSNNLSVTRLQSNFQAPRWHPTMQGAGVAVTILGDTSTVTHNFGNTPLSTPNGASLSEKFVLGTMGSEPFSLASHFLASDVQTNSPMGYLVTNGSFLGVAFISHSGFLSGAVTLHPLNTEFHGTRNVEVSNISFVGIKFISSDASILVFKDSSLYGCELPSAEFANCICNVSGNNIIIEKTEISGYSNSLSATGVNSSILYVTTDNILLTNAQATLANIDLKSTATAVTVENAHASQLGGLRLVNTAVTAVSVSKNSLWDVSAGVISGTTTGNSMEVLESSSALGVSAYASSLSSSGGVEIFVGSVGVSFSALPQTSATFLCRAS